MDLIFILLGGAAVLHPPLDKIFKEFGLWSPFDLPVVSRGLPVKSRCGLPVWSLCGLCMASLRFPHACWQLWQGIVGVVGCLDIVGCCWQGTVGVGSVVKPDWCLVSF